MRVGDTSKIKVDVRVIAASNVDLNAAVKSGPFRLDLFYRLNIINVPVPVLCDRKEDIPKSLSHFVQYYSGKYNKNVNAVPQYVVELLMVCEWPSNVREFENVIQRAVW